MESMAGMSSMPGMPQMSMSSIAATTASMAMTAASTMAPMSAMSMSHSGGMSSMSGMDGMDGMGSMGGMGGMGDMGGMGGMGGEDGMSCKMSMLGNWNTIGSCFLTRSWRISTEAQFAGTCIGIAFWVILTECIRRWAREYDRHIIAQASQDILRSQASPSEKWLAYQEIQNLLYDEERAEIDRTDSRAFPANVFSSVLGIQNSPMPRALRLRPTLQQQIIRSLFHAIQFTSAYLLMLFAMYYNGYILLSIILGSMIGYFASTWDTLGTAPLSGSACNMARNPVNTAEATTAQANQPERLDALPVAPLLH